MYRLIDSKTCFFYVPTEIFPCLIKKKLCFLHDSIGKMLHFIIITVFDSLYKDESLFFYIQTVKCKTNTYPWE